MTPADFALTFSLGLAGSLHCASMCGPIVLSYSLAAPGRIATHVAYNAGRLLTYMALGAIAGSAGGGMTVLGGMAGVGQTASIVAGILMAAAGLVMLGLVPKPGLVKIGGGSNLLSKTAGRLLRSPSAASKFALGLVLGLLPCGVLYAAILKAMGTATAASGALSMLAFGLGTSFALVAVGAMTSALRIRFGRWTNVVAAVSIIAAGLFIAWRGFAMMNSTVCPFHGKS